MPLRRVAALCWIAIAPLLAQPSALSVNPASREEVRQFFRAVYHASENIPMQWTGDYASGNPGDTSIAFKEATRLRVNFYRALAGVPAGITFNPEYSVKAQQAALMMSANNALQHVGIPTTWTFYTAHGAEAAANSNLAIGTSGPASVDGYVADSGDNNAAVGHRRWLFFPQTRRMGTGDVPGDGGSLRPANALWVIDTTPGGRTSDPRPGTRTTEVAYPPAGFIPHSLVWPRWSFSHPGADFSGTVITMTRNGQPIAVAREPLVPNGGGESTIVWVYNGLNADDQTPHPRPAADTPYEVTVSNVRIGNTTRNFTYVVTVFDPDVPGSDTTPVALVGPSTPSLFGMNVYTVAKPAFTPEFDWRTVQLTPWNKLYTADTGTDDLVVSATPGYDVVQSNIAISGVAFRLAHLPERSDQSLRFPGTFLISANSSVMFQSRLGVATAIETARVQISTDEGVTWTDVFTQTGTSAINTPFPVPVETSFVSRTIPISAYAGRTVAVRLVYSINPSGTAFLPDPTNAVGWFIDNLTLANVQSVNANAPTRMTAGNTFAFAPMLAGPVALQARGVIAGGFPLEWGPVFAAVAIAGDASSSASYLANLSVRTATGAGDNTLIVGFAINGGTKSLLVRGIGPALAGFGVTGALGDPKLELYGNNGKIAENDNWDAATRASFGAVGAFDLPNGSRDAVILQTLAPASYTAQLSASTGSSGVALVELYDAAGGSNGARLVNVSARSRVGTGDDILVAGFNVAGSGARSLLIRAVGPTLTAFNVSGALADPRLELYRGSTKIEENDNWTPALAEIFPRVGAFQLTANSRDAALLVTLPPGSYTAQISGANNTTGIALVEVYEVP